MAQIPMGQGRRVMPGSAPMHQVTGVEAGMASARALENLGQTGIQVATGLMAQQTHLDVQAKQAADSEARSAAALRLEEGKLNLRLEAKTLAERVIAGDLAEKDLSGEWKSISSRVQTNMTADIAPDHKEIISKQLRIKTDELGGLVLQDAVRTRTRDVTRANVLSTMELFERNALEDRPKAVLSAEQLLTSLGPAAGLGPDDQFRALQGFRERTAYNLGERMVLGAGKNLQALDGVSARVNSDEFADLSPERRQSLEVKISNHRAQIAHEQDTAQRRSEALVERRLRDAEHSTKALQTMIDGGALPDDKTLSEVQARTAHTPYAGAVKALISQGAERAAFGSMTPDQQQERLVQARTQLNQQGASPAALERLKTFEGIASKTRDLVERDPLMWGLQSRLLTGPAPLRMDSLNSLAESLGERAAQAQLVAAQLRKPVSPLFANEAQRLGEMMAALPLEQKKGAVRMLAQGLPPEQQRALAGQLNEQDNALALAMHASSLPQGGGADAVELILRGQDAVKAGRIKKDDTVTALDRAKIAKELNAVAWATPRARDAAVQAAWLIYDGQRDAKGSGSQREAVKLATGGGLAEWGDGKVPVPPGWTESRFRSSMRSLSADELTRQSQGPLFIGASEIAPADLLRAMPKATLIPLGPGRYAIDAGGMVVDAKRRPFVFTLGN